MKHGIGHYPVGRRGADGTRQAVPARSLRRALVEELGRPLAETFAELAERTIGTRRRPASRSLRGEGEARSPVEFEQEPLAAASVAQVYRARLHSGDDVVVTVRRPGIDRVVERDLDIVYRFARSLELRAKWARTLGVVDLADGFAAALSEELDFRVEARNIAAVSAVDTGADITLPTVHTELSSERVLVMRRLDGTPVRTAIGAVDDERRAGLARALLDCVLRQVLLHGVFHADPHPGNVLLLADGRLGLLDFGSVGRLDASLRGGLRDVLAAVDPAGLRDGLLEIVDRPDEIDEQRLERALGALIAKHVSHGQAPDLDMFTDLFRVVAEFRLSIPPAIAAVFRALATVEGTLALLSPGVQHPGGVSGVREQAGR